MKTIIVRSQNLFRYREFIYSEILRELTTRFSRSKIGGFWALIHPLAYAALLGFVFSVILSQSVRVGTVQINFTSYVMAGTLGWTLFTDVIMRMLTVFIDRGSLMKKIPFPRVCLPFIAGGVALANNLILLVAVLAVFAFIGPFPTATLLWLPLLVILNVALALGVGLFLGVLNVFVRDIGQVVPIVLQFLFWFTPVVYSPSLIPEKLRVFLHYNPLFSLVHAYQQCLVFGASPSWGSLKWVVLLAGLSLAMAWAFYKRSAAELVDAI